MQISDGSKTVIPVASLKAFFQRPLKDAAEAQNIVANDEVIAYLTRLLTDYARSESLYDRTKDGMIRRPLVDLYRRANEAGSAAERDLLLQLGLTPQFSPPLQLGR